MAGEVGLVPNVATVPVEPIVAIPGSPDVMTRGKSSDESTLCMPGI